MMRLTRDRALRLMSQRYIRPNKSHKIIQMVKMTMIAEYRSQPSKMKVTTKMALRQMARLVMESCTMVRYCS